MKLLITGDFFVAKPEEISIDNNVKQIFDSCDYRIVNLEGPIADDNYDFVGEKSGPRLMQPGSVVGLLKSLNIDCLSLANNHIMDQGIQGYKKTVDTLNGFTLIGAGTWKDAYNLTIISKDGLKVGLLNVCEMQFGMLYDEWTQDDESIGCAWVNNSKVNNLIVENKKKVDVLVAICHAGVEMIDIPLPEWRDRYREMIDLGCDAVIAHHPHVVQGYEIYKKAPICYSLGNFCFVGDKTNNSMEWKTGAISILEVQKDVVKLNTVGIRVLEHTTMTIIPKDEWDDYITKRNNLLYGDGYLERVNEACLHLLANYRNMFAMGGLFPADRHWLKHLARIVAKRYNVVHALNNLQCESHRWCISRALRLEQPLI